MVLAGLVDRSRLKGVPAARIKLMVHGVDDGDWLLRLSEDEVGYSAADDSTLSDVAIGMDVTTWTDIIAGRVNPTAAAMDGKLTISGDITKALALEAIL